MYETTESVDFQMQKPNWQRRYESEEEDISESELAQDHAFSPVESQRTNSTFDSDLSVDEDPESDVETQVSRLLSPHSSTRKGSRPGSMNTVKRTSSATFVADSLIFDQDDDMILKLPSPDSTSPLHSPMLLQPSVYVPTESPSTGSQSPRSSSPTSIFSDDESDVFVAEQVVYVEPIAKPSIVVISPSASSPPDEYSEEQRSSSEQGLSREEKYQKVHPLRQSMDSDAAYDPFYDNGKTTKDQENAQREALPEPSATINNLSEIPEVPYSMSPRSRSKSFSRPLTALPEKGHRSLFPNALRRPPSLRSFSSTSLPFWNHPASPFVREDTHHRSASYSPSIYDSDSSPLQARWPASRNSCSSRSYTSPVDNRKRSGSVYSASGIPSTFSPLRHHVLNHSANSSAYSASTRPASARSSMEFVEQTDKDPKKKESKRRSVRRSKYGKPEGSEQSIGRSFMGLWLGAKRRSTSKLI